MIDANIIMEVVNGGGFSALRGIKTLSISKKQTATAEVKPGSKKKYYTMYQIT